jgi:lactoylglutathione lyase
MEITGFNHFAIKTIDYEASLAFYRDILGLTQLDTVENKEGRFTNLRIPGGCIVELMQIRNRGKDAMPGAEALVDHIAFDVDDVAATEKTLRKYGVDIILPCTEMKAFNTRVVKCKDPNGVLVSLRKDIE